MTTGERILQLLPATRAQLLDLLGCAKPTLHKWLTRLQESGTIRICGWQRTTAVPAAVFGIGPGKDAPKPKPFTGAQLQARYRQSLREKGMYEDVLMKQRKYRARVSTRRPRFTQDPLLAAFFADRV